MKNTLTIICLLNLLCIGFASKNDCSNILREHWRRAFGQKDWSELRLKVSAEAEKKAEERLVERRKNWTLNHGHSSGILTDGRHYVEFYAHESCFDLVSDLIKYEDQRVKCPTFVVPLARMYSFGCAVSGTDIVDCVLFEPRNATAHCMDTYSRYVNVQTKNITSPIYAKEAIEISKDFLDKNKVGGPGIFYTKFAYTVVSESCVQFVKLLDGEKSLDPTLAEHIPIIEVNLTDLSYVGCVVDKMSEMLVCTLIRQLPELSSSTEKPQSLSWWNRIFG